MAVLAIVCVGAACLSHALPTSPSGDLIPGWLGPIAQRSGLAYPAHAALATLLERSGASPGVVATQWVKAASHASSADEIDRAATAIAAARQHGSRELDIALCSAVLDGSSPTVRQAIEFSGAPCNFDLLDRYHVPIGPIRYRTHPPASGPHFDAWFPRYGVVEEPVDPGLWVHNLEHGAVVLLYNCPATCPDLVDQLRKLYATLPAGHNSRGGAARLLVTPYDTMRYRIAVVAWGDRLVFDELDLEQIREFYVRYLDRGPECEDLRCPG